MIPRKFEYFAPTTVAQAVSLLRKYKDEAKILSGGMSLIPMMKLRLVSPQYVIDINNIKSLNYIKDSGRVVRIGALVRHADIEHSPVIREKFPMMVDAAAHIADMQVRNLGTFVGALAHADPAADWPASALALDAELVAQGSSKRIIKATKFFKGPFETALKPTELLVEALLPVPKGPKLGQAYLKFERKAGDYAIVGVASSVVLNENNEFEKVALALTAVNPFPFRATDAEQLLIGQKPSKELIEQAAKTAASMSDPSSDLRGSAEYKKEMARVFTRRSLNKALERAGVAL
ncbi:MAG: xanthine dehydrogenase family protein subunit M [Candidatus Caldarchaeum sp.]|nr:xanthine dehydrogenase family protein subunit M [Candidatus Caldarchaeum sp.]MCX8201901.1 xanthine dehydrogenase family protein subunit M [Candidatus Caldarchaeum sp.]MDW8062671.1 xanthine dehydrogenase family protein subunit M [Candidatus Caldarchaeum sp.]MDW8435441.1 xanthine dehydrogenase family protein subunit M [Candidatus Caldarchaeum sp.]